MKKILAIILALGMLFVLTACTGSGSSLTASNDVSSEEEYDPEKAFAQLKDNLNKQNAYITSADVYKNLDAEEVFLTANIKNNSDKTISNLVVAFAAWDIDGNPIMIKSKSGATADSYIKEVSFSSVTISPGQEWLGNGDDDGDIFGFSADPSQSNIAYTQAIVVSYTVEDGGEWSNSFYSEWKTTFKQAVLEDWMK